MFLALFSLALAGPMQFTTVDGQTVTLPDAEGRPFVVEMVRSLDW